MFPKLYIYDSSSAEDREQASFRFSKDDNVWVLGVHSKGHLIAELNRLLVEPAYFSRVLVQTHGGAGNIKFNGGSIYDTTLTADFTRYGFHRLFPFYTKIYFDGCNVAEGTLGDDFLNAVGSIFLRNGGGEVFGWTSPGYGMTGGSFPFYFPFRLGHTIHFSGELKKFYFTAGGRREVRAPEPVIIPYPGPPPA